MVGQKGRSGRPRTLPDGVPEVEMARIEALKEYYDNREYKLKYAKEYHIKNLEVLKLAKKLGVSVPQARKVLEEQKYGFIWK